MPKLPRPHHLPQVPQHNERRFADFEVIDKIAENRQTELFRARYLPKNRSKRDPLMQLRYGEPLVVRLLKNEFWEDPAHVKVFKRQSQILEHINKAGIPKFLAKSHDGEQPWFAMQYVEGETLSTIHKAFVGQKIRMQPELAAFIILQLAQSLQALHQFSTRDHKVRTLIHGSLNPNNIMLDHHGRVYITDFTTCVRAKKDFSQVNQEYLLGYFSPEQARFEKAEVTSDIYVLGILFFELLTSKKAFDTSNVQKMELLEQIKKVHAQGIAPQWPAHITVPKQYRKLVFIMLHANKMERPESLQDLCARLLPLAAKKDAAKHALSELAKDLVRSNRERSAPLFVK